MILVGERLATVPGALSAAARLADATGARLAWVPRRAGERGALDAGALPGLLPGGRPFADDAARAQVSRAWSVDELPSAAGRDAAGILAAAADGTLGALVVGGVEPDDFADPDAALAALDAAGFVVSLELRHSAVTEARRRGVPGRAGGARSPAPSSTGRAATARSTRRCTAPPRRPASPITGCSTRWPTRWASTWVPPPSRRPARSSPRWAPGTASPHRRRASRPREPARPAAGEAVLTGWRMLLDDGRLQDGEPHLAGTAHNPVVRLSADTAAEIGAADGDAVTVSTDRAVDHPAVVRRRHARPGCVAAAQLARLGGAPAARGHRRQRRARIGVSS